MNIKPLVNTIKCFVIKNSSSILTGLGISGFVATAIMANRAADHGNYALEEAKNDNLERIHALEIPESKPVTVVKNTAHIIRVVGPVYAPAIATGALSTAAILGANHISIRKNAALTAAYSVSEKALTEYQNKVIDTIGKDKEQKITDAIASDHVLATPLPEEEDSQIIQNKDTDTLCFDKYSGRYFYANIEDIRKTMNNFNKEIMDHMASQSVNDWYEYLSLAPIKMGDDLGWCADEPLLDLKFSSQLTMDKKPCLVIDFENGPFPNYNEFSV